VGEFPDRESALAQTSRTALPWWGPQERPKHKVRLDDKLSRKDNYQRAEGPVNNSYPCWIATSAAGGAAYVTGVTSENCRTLGFFWKPQCRGSARSRHTVVCCVGGGDETECPDRAPTARQRGHYGLTVALIGTYMELICLRASPASRADVATSSTNSVLPSFILCSQVGISNINDLILILCARCEKQYQRLYD